MTIDYLIILQSTMILREIEKPSYSGLLFFIENIVKQIIRMFLSNGGCKVRDPKGRGGIMQGVTKTHVRQSTTHDICISQCILLQ